MERDATAPTDRHSLKRPLTAEAESSNKKKILSLSKKKSEQQPIVTKLETYTCPICEVDLTDINSSYLRQKHVEKCMDNPSDEIIDTLDCFFCGKALSHMNMARRQIHINHCLDNVEEELKKKKDGQLSLLETLTICPVCHESTPFDRRCLKQKIVHIKQCRSLFNLSMPQLIQRLRWIGWGHTSTVNNNNNNASNDIQVVDHNNYNKNKVTHELRAVDCSTFDDDDNFANNIIVSRMNQSLWKPQRSDKSDDDLQMALALSRSLHTSQKRKAVKDLNASNIWSAEESKQMAYEKLDLILFPDDQSELIQQERERSIGSMRLSSIKTMEKNVRNVSYWKLPSIGSQDNNSIFVSNFIHQLRIKK
ncbi:hypothetical protein RMATCC62417_00579 [Rhizopus microsporus]|nr:hypothetical protein RMATCC62417_00579 [Rhizopus microsporus]